MISRIAFFQAAQVVQGRTDNRKQSYNEDENVAIEVVIDH